MNIRLKNLGLRTCTLLSLACLGLQAQTKDSLLFLGDTLSLNHAERQAWKSQGEPLLRPITGTDSKFIVQQIGKLSFKDQQYRIADPLDDGVTKILVIGNSFSDDGVEYYLHDLAKQAGHPLVIGNLFRGGAPLDFHLKNALENIDIYDYRKTEIDGAKSNQRKTSIRTALQDENWDIICFQQASVLSGDLPSVEKDLPLLFAYVKENYPISSVKYAYHQTWAYAENATTKNFERYANNQQQMFEDIANVSKNIQQLIPLNYLIPAGTAIQNGRSSFIGDNFTREGYHLDLRIGRFTAASTWYEAIFGKLQDNPYKPFNLTQEQAAVAKISAIKAVENPYQITSLAYLKAEELPTAFGTIQVNFGADLIMPGWNSFLFERKHTKLSGLSSLHNKESSAYISLLQHFDARSAKGPKRTSSDFHMPAEVSQAYFSVVLNAENTKQAFLEIGNLNPSQAYSLALFSGVENQQNEMEIWVKTGQNIQSNSINPSYNKTQVVTFPSVQPSADGKLQIGFKIPKNSKESTAILNALRIVENKQNSIN